MAVTTLSRPNASMISNIITMPPKKTSIFSRTVLLYADEILYHKYANTHFHQLYSHILDQNYKAYYKVHHIGYMLVYKYTRSRSHMFYWSF